MINILAKYFSVVSLSMFKFIFGPVTGVALGLSLVETWLLTVLGMMLTVLIISFGGTELRKFIFRKFYKNRKIFTPTSRRVVKIWSKYGLVGVSFLTPLLFSPIGGAIVAVSFGAKRKEIIFYMFISALAWGLFYTVLITLGGEKIMQYINV